MNIFKSLSQLAIYLSIVFSFSQEYIQVDLGSNAVDRSSQFPVNNIATSLRARFTNGVLLYNSQGISSGINLQVHDAWTASNTAGTQSPDVNLGISKNASRDCFYGASGTFTGTVEATAGFKLRDLDPNKYYSLSFFGSRLNVNDNRETSYTAIGNATQTVYLDVANNMSNTAQLLNLQPDAQAEITITAAAGANNTNASQFYYLNTLDIQVTDMPISQWTTPTDLKLNYPINPVTWETGETVQILWSSSNNAAVTIEYSTDGGATFSTIAMPVATDGHYDFIVPNTITSNALIKLSNGSNSFTSAPIEIIDNVNTTYKIIVLGSSTAAGTGPSHKSNV